MGIKSEFTNNFPSRTEANNYSEGEVLGLATTEALQRLHDDIETVLLAYEERYAKRRWLLKFKSSFVKNLTSAVNWFSLLATGILVVSLFLTGYCLSASFVLLLLLLTVFIIVRENNLRNTEIFRKVRDVLEEIKCGIQLCADWTPSNYPHLCSPLSPCVTLQWTYRDGKIANLPWALLVRGDYIVMRPGQVSPGTCTEISGKRSFKCGETYGLTKVMEPPKKPTARTPIPDLTCIVEVTPYLDNLRTTLDNFLNRPDTIINQQRDLLVTKCIQQWGFAVVFALTSLVGILRYFGFYFNGKVPTSWSNIFLLNPSAALLPILPLIFPILWITINLWGTARLEALLSIPQAVMRAQAQKSFQEDLDTPTGDLDHAKLPRRMVAHYWWQLFVGRSELLSRSANVVQVLGTITALCCVDKKGILSWPNPTAEKVFFLRNASNDENQGSDQSDQSSLNSQCCQEHYHPLSRIIELSSQKEGSGAIAEVLDLTHDQHSPFKLEFDDHAYKNHLNSLKPLGLAILVNTCCPLTQAHYARFCGHVTAVAMLDKDLVPVTNRRCLCELARQIGFTSHARDIFNLEGQISSYRHLQPDVVRRDIKFARSLQLAAKVKVPFPHSLSVVMRETPGGSLQLLTQGTADMVMDSCDDYWNGQDLNPLTEKERKRAQDFYQRSALTAYCTAFAYRPLRHGITGALSGGVDGEVAYMELPPETKNRKDMYIRENLSEFDNGGAPLTHHSISTDSLLFSENKEDDISDVDGCYEMQCHQVFIGMITMQYQAQTDIVQLIERLERACIRFVHFSKENELRSRVFSEKMGLESGWNCHISLLSESDSEMSSPTKQFELKVHSMTPSDQRPAQVAQENELNKLLPNLEASKALSSSAPGAISDPDSNLLDIQNAHNRNPSIDNSNDSFGMRGFQENLKLHRRASQDSAMDCAANDDNCRSLSCLTDSTEQSAPINFDMSNRAKLPRGIENIRPHLENVDNVPLLVSLFTDCSAEATREMLKIMQQYGEIVVCLGSSASNSNSEIFLQGDCSIAIEPLYPQVCQDYSAYTEANIYNNKGKIRPAKQCKLFRPIPDKIVTISPIYLSRMLNSISCSIAMCRDDPISIVDVIELSRRFILGLWSCVQFWACCGVTLAVMNTITAIISLPPMVIPHHALYLMCFAVPLISLTLLRIEPDAGIMKRATGKKQTCLDSRLIIFVLWCYGIKFSLIVLFLVISYCSFLSHPIEIFSGDEDDDATENFTNDLAVARSFVLLGIVIHFVTISASFVHRDYTSFRRNPLSNLCWVSVAAGLLVFHTLIVVVHVCTNEYYWQEVNRIWPVVLFLILTAVVTFAITEFFKWEEIKVNSRYIRRARLDFGTKLGMNSPF
ncbi:transmembrane protein 94 isoform X2 [Toxorhynchites rutilus septentrionalis]|uniref:transmembrane protein 94 isoform X2 n=1 Tax=Toxorhynchites rutilus septentrionalis TaxID=329112 RepID=UPI002479BBEE|nr:transmembrane protein 94 isoform X2 [Toxorhynchites rutilus septentrionalis]